MQRVADVLNCNRLIKLCAVRTGDLPEENSVGGQSFSDMSFKLRRLQFLLLLTLV